MAIVEIKVTEGDIFNVIAMVNKTHPTATISPNEWYPYNKSRVFEIQTVSGTAVGGADYTSVNTTFQWEQQADKTPDIKIISDGVNEGEEKFEFVLKCTTVDEFNETIVSEWQYRVTIIGSGTQPPGDKVAPVAENVSPQSGGDFPANSNIEIYFDENVVAGGGSISLLKDGVVIENFSGSKIAIQGSTATINPTNDFVPLSKYTVQVNAGAVKDPSGNANFSKSFEIVVPKVKDTTPPTITDYPGRDGSVVDHQKDLVITFSEAILESSGKVQLLKIVDGKETVVETFDFGSRMKASGSTLTIDPIKDLDLGANYAIRFTDKLVKDADGNQSSLVTHTFKTADPPVVSFEQTANNTFWFEGMHPDGVQIFTIKIDRILAKELVVPYRIVGEDGTLATAAVAGKDYSGSATGVAIIKPGQLTAEIKIEIIDNKESDGIRRFHIEVDDGEAFNLPESVPLKSRYHDILDDDGVATKLDSPMEDGAEFTKRDGLQVAGERIVTTGRYERTTTGDFVATGTTVAANTKGSGVSGLMANVGKEVAIGGHEWVATLLGTPAPNAGARMSETVSSMSTSEAFDPSVFLALTEKLAGVNDFMADLITDQFSDLDGLITQLKSPSSSWNGDAFAQAYEQKIVDFPSTVMGELQTQIAGDALEPSLLAALPKVESALENFMDVHRVLIALSPDGQKLSFNSDIDDRDGASGWSVSDGWQMFAFGFTRADKFTGDTANDCLMGFAGNDTIEGKAGDDVLVGGSGADILTGDIGVDRIWGGDGSDTINGGASRDVMYGGLGADTFVYSSSADSPWKGMTDLILGFDGAEDKIDLSAIDANSSRRGGQAFRWEGYSKYYSDQGEVDYFYKKGTTFVYGYTDRDDKPEFVIWLDGKVTLDSTDFIL